MRIKHNPIIQVPNESQEPKIEETFIEEIKEDVEEVEVAKEMKLIYSEEENKFVFVEEE